MTLMAWRLSKLYEDGKMSHAMASNVKVRLMCRSYPHKILRRNSVLVETAAFGDTTPCARPSGYLTAKHMLIHLFSDLCQAWNTLRGRETVALARELLGGNGVVSDFLVAKAFSDMEAIYTCAAHFKLLHSALASS